MQIRKFGKTREVVPVPSLVNLQSRSYDEFLDADAAAEVRDQKKGLEAIYRELFPITGLDDKIQVTYHGYEFTQPQHTIDECRDLGLTYQRGIKLKIRVAGEGLANNVLEEAVHIGYFPIRIGGGEFIVNGAERTIVTQIQRSPGVDFSAETATSGKRNFSCRIIPERGSWIQVEQTTKDALVVKIDKSAKVYATCFLRAMSKDHATTDGIIKEFFQTETVEIAGRGAKDKIVGHLLAADVVNKEDGEVLLKACSLVNDGAFNNFRDLGIDSVVVITGVDVNGQIQPVKQDDILLNTLRQDEAASHDEALLRIYRRLRPGNPTDEAKVREFFQDRFLNESRYNLGAVGRFRINRKLRLEGETHHSRILTTEDYVKTLKYLLALIRSNSMAGELDDIDHLGNRRVRPIADLLSDELRAAMLKLRRAVKEKLSRDLQQEDLAAQLAPRNLFNNQAVDSAIQNFFQRGELSQVVDQSNLLSQLTHERRLSALGPGGLNRKRAGFEVRDVHT